MVFYDVELCLWLLCFIVEKMELPFEYLLLFVLILMGMQFFSHMNSRIHLEWARLFIDTCDKITSSPFVLNTNARSGVGGGVGGGACGGAFCADDDAAQQNNRRPRPAAAA